MYEEIFEKLNYKFNNPKLLERAFTHSSFAHETAASSVDHNERLEFLGDAVLELLISELLYRRFPDYDEGQLTKFRAGLVCEASLSKIAREEGFERNLRLGKGEEGSGGREKDALLADVFEAVTGAVFLDGGFERARNFIHARFEDEVNRQADSYEQFDNKTMLQESYQKFSKVPLNYIITDESGPDHHKTFTAKVTHKGKVLGEGAGRSKKEAEQNAAAEALKSLE